MSNLEKLIAILESAKNDAYQVFLQNKASGASSESLAFDSGRYDGLKQALELVAEL